MCLFSLSIATMLEGRFLQYITNTTVFMANKTGRMSYIDCLPPMNLLKFMITWSYRIMRQAKTIISMLKQCLWLLNLASYLAVVIAPVQFLLYVHTLCTHKAMLTYILINVQYLRNIAFSFEIGLNDLNISLPDYCHWYENLSQQNSLFSPTC